MVASVVDHMAGLPRKDAHPTPSEGGGRGASCRQLLNPEAGLQKPYGKVFINSRLARGVSPPGPVPVQRQAADPIARSRKGSSCS
jgi:hypothetical protein